MAYITVSIFKSDAKNKRFKAYFINNDGDIIKTINFGSSTGQTYIDHGDEVKKRNYIARHKVNENWDNLFTAGALSRFILWGPYTNLQKNIDDYNKRINTLRISQ